MFQVRDALLALIEEETKGSDVDLDIESSTAETEGEGESVLDVLMHSGDSLNCEDTHIVCMHLFLLFWQSLARGFTKSVEVLYAFKLCFRICILLSIQPPSQLTHMYFSRLSKWTVRSLVLLQRKLQHVRKTTKMQRMFAKSFGRAARNS